jgi:protoporphyrinogen oxidase
MNKNELKREFKDGIDDVFHNIQELENKSEELSGKSKDELNEKIAMLQKKKDEMDSFYEELLNSSEEKAEEINVRFKKSIVNFKKGFKEIAGAF